MEDLVSVIIPTYKRTKEYFARAINCVINQTYKNVEIILVDDNAKEELKAYRRETENYIKELLSKQTIAINYIQNPENFGSAKTRNEGIKVAKGDIIAFLDDDDCFLPEKIEKQIKYMKENDLDMCFSNQILVDENNNVVDYREYRRLKDFDNLTILKYHLTKKITGTNTFMVKKEVLEKIGGFNGEDMGDEYYLMYDIIKTDCKIGYYDGDYVVATRAGQSSLTLNSNRLQNEKNLFKFIKKEFEVLSLRERNYVRFRYNVIKAITYKRAKKYLKTLFYLGIAFLCSPLSGFVEALRMKKNIKKIREQLK